MTWTEEQIAELKCLARKLTAQQISEQLQRPYQQVRHQLRKQGFRTKSPHQRSLRESQEIFDHSQKHGCKSAALKFKLTLDSVKSIRSRQQKRTQTRNKNLSVEEIHDFREKAQKYAARHGMMDYSKDFGSYAVLQKIQNPDRRSALKNLFYDYKKTEFGDRTKKKGLLKLQARSKTVIIGSEDQNGQIIDVVAEEPDASLQSWLSMIEQSQLSQSERVSILLFGWIGLSQNEIALIFGVTQSYISRIIRDGQDKMRITE